MQFLLIFLLIFGCKSVDDPDKKTVNEIHPDDITEVGFFQTAPNKLGEWSVTPEISICESSAVTQSQVEDAAAWWKERGYEELWEEESRSSDSDSEWSRGGMAKISQK